MVHKSQGNRAELKKIVRAIFTAHHDQFETQPSKAGSGCDSKSVEAYLDNELPAILLGIVFSFTFRLYPFEKILTLA